MIIQIDKPTKYADSVIFRKQTGYEYSQTGDEYFLSGEATEKELLDAFAAHNPDVPYDNSADKAALLTRLGITADEAKLLLS